MRVNPYDKVELQYSTVQYSTDSSNQLLVTLGCCRTWSSGGQRAELQFFETNKRCQSHFLDKDVGGRVRKVEGT